MNTIPDVEKEIIKAWNDADSADMFEHEISKVFIVQQFFGWEDFKTLVSRLTGYNFRRK